MERENCGSGISMVIAFFETVCYLLPEILQAVLVSEVMKYHLSD